MHEEDYRTFLHVLMVIASFVISFFFITSLKDFDVSVPIIFLYYITTFGCYWILWSFVLIIQTFFNKLVYKEYTSTQISFITIAICIITSFIYLLTR